VLSLGGSYKYPNGWRDDIIVFFGGWIADHYTNMKLFLDWYYHLMEINIHFSDILKNGCCFAILLSKNRNCENGLISNHDYVLLDIINFGDVDSSETVNRFVIRNPHRKNPALINSLEFNSEKFVNFSKDKGDFCVSLDELCENFSSISIAWCPSLFKFCKVFPFKVLFEDKHLFLLEKAKHQFIWIQLHRHIQKELNVQKQKKFPLYTLKLIRHNDNFGSIYLDNNYAYSNHNTQLFKICGNYEGNYTMYISLLHHSIHKEFSPLLKNNFFTIRIFSNHEIKINKILN
jgi:hypothetical protein